MYHCISILWMRKLIKKFTNLCRSLRLCFHVIKKFTESHTHRCANIHTQNLSLKHINAHSYTQKIPIDLTLKFLQLSINLNSVKPCTQNEMCINNTFSGSSARIGCQNSVNRAWGNEAEEIQTFADIETFFYE